MVPVVLASAVLFALVVMIAIEVLRLRAAARRPKVRHRHPRRQELLEDRIRDAFDGPRAQFGNEFTRCLVVRHLWRALDALVQGSVVIVDQPSQQWSKKIDAAFDDGGVDPWGPRPTFESGRL